MLVNARIIFGITGFILKGMWHQLQIMNYEFVNRFRFTNYIRSGK